MSKFSNTMQNPSLAGILLVICGGFIFSIQDVIIKFISGSYPVHEIVFFRSLFGLLPILVIVRLEGGIHLLRMHSKKFHVIRGILMFLSYTSYYLAISLIPLAFAVTLFLCAPLFISILSVIFLDEKMTGKNWAALFAGFLGILVVMRPDMSAVQSGQGMINPGAILALSSGLFYAVNAVCTRKYGIRESGSSLVFYPIFTYILFSGIAWMTIGDGRFANEQNQNMAFLLRNWVFPADKDFLLLLVIGVVAATGTFCLSQAYRISNASVVAPFEYFVIPISVTWGYLFWREIPGIAQFIGIFMIIVSGVYVLQKHTRSIG